jgi:hypothetical protein
MRASEWVEGKSDGTDFMRRLEYRPERVAPNLDVSCHDTHNLGGIDSLGTPVFRATRPATQCA